MPGYANVPVSGQPALTGGRTYRFRMRAYNKYGFGLDTAEVTMQTSQEPETPASASLIVIGDNVEISWVTPFANHSPVLGYQILIKTKGALL